jgi:DNA (cytosine-5)-methyltransferase 1
MVARSRRDITELIAEFRKRPRAIDLFSGVGGLSYGLERSGFDVAVSVELEDIAGRYAQYNSPLSKVLYGPKKGDVKNFNPDAYQVLGLRGEIHLVAGGPPCQGFSIAGKKSKDDPLNDLVLEFARIVREFKPLAFLMENVPGMKSSDSPRLGQALSALEKAYSVCGPTTLNAWEYGVPQMRKRVFIVGFRKDLRIKPSLPSPTHLRPSPGQLAILPFTPTVEEAISDLPEVDKYECLLSGDRVPYDRKPEGTYQEVMRGYVEAGGLAAKVSWDSKVCTNLRRTQHGDDLLERLRNLQFGEADGMSGIRRLDPKDISTTIRAGTTKDRGSWSAPRPLHPYQDRVITTRECARIQSFPDWFLFHPAKWNGNRMVGNAVPPLLAEAIGRHILKLLGIKVSRIDHPPFERDKELVARDIEEAANANYENRRVSHRLLLVTQKEAISVTSKISELYGKAAHAAGVDWRELISAQRCPFLGRKCRKNRKSDPEVTIGTCSVRHGSDDVILICPYRLLERRQIFTDCIHLLTLHEPGNEFHVIPEITVPGGSIDYVLASVRKGKVLDFVGIELQSLDSTGSIWPERQRFAKEHGISGIRAADVSDRKPFGMNWKMTAKTILVQLHHKVGTFQGLGKHLVLVIQDVLLEYMKTQPRPFGPWNSWRQRTGSRWRFSHTARSPSARSLPNRRRSKTTWWWGS